MQAHTKDSSTLSPPSQRPRLDNAPSQQWIVQYYQPVKTAGVDRLPYHLIGWWVIIWEYLNPTQHDRLHLRRLCHLFKDSLKPPPPGIYTEFPHPNHTSLDSLINRMNVLHDEDPTKAPSIIFIAKGDHEIEGYFEDQNVGTADIIEPLHVPYLLIKYPLIIFGAGRDMTAIHGGGFSIEGSIDDRTQKVEVEGLTVSGTKGCGLHGNGGLVFACKDITFTKCESFGVGAWNTTGRLQNCVVTQCGYSGIFSGYDALIELEGIQTNVNGNVINGNVNHYGLNTYNDSAAIHLLSPLTKESVSANNVDGQNYGSCWGGGVIQTIEALEA